MQQIVIDNEKFLPNEDVIDSMEENKWLVNESFENHYLTKEDSMMFDRNPNENDNFLRKWLSLVSNEEERWRWTDERSWWSENEKKKHRLFCCSTSSYEHACLHIDLMFKWSKIFPSSRFLELNNRRNEIIILSFPWFLGQLNMTIAHTQLVPLFNLVINEWMNVHMARRREHFQLLFFSLSSPFLFDRCSSNKWRWAYWSIQLQQLSDCLELKTLARHIVNRRKNVNDWSSSID